MKQSSVWWVTTNGSSAKSKKVWRKSIAVKCWNRKKSPNAWNVRLPKNSVGPDASSLDLGSGRGLRKHRELSLRENTRKRCALDTRNLQRPIHPEELPK